MRRAEKILQALGMIRILKSCYVFFALLLLLGCNEEPECDAVCELQKAYFERLTTWVDFEACKDQTHNRRGVVTCSFPNTDVYMYKTSTGAIARYRHWGRFESMETELSMDEWLDFIKSLYKYLNKYPDEDFNETNEYGKREHGDVIFTRQFSVGYNTDTNEYDLDRLRRLKTSPSDWDGVEKLVAGMMATIMERAEKPFEDKLKAEYQERFGEPMSDFELSTKVVDFWMEDSSCFNISVFKTEIGAYAESCGGEADLSTGDWLDFVRALYKSGADRLEKKYGESLSSEHWVLDIYSSGRLDMDRVEGYGAYPPNWRELKKAMEDINARIKMRSRK